MLRPASPCIPAGILPWGLEAWQQLGLSDVELRLAGAALRPFSHAGISPSMRTLVAPLTAASLPRSTTELTRNGSEVPLGEFHLDNRLCDGL